MMKGGNIPVLALLTYACVGACLPIASASAAEYRNAVIEKLQATYADTNCFYFTLQGVAQADPVVPASPWFAVLRSQTGAADVYALAVGAKLSGASVWVTTTGTSVCGYAGVRYLILE